MSMAATRTLASWRTWSSSSPGATVDGPRHAGLAGRGHLPQRSRAQYTSRAFAEHCRALLRPLIAVRPPTPPRLRTALRTIDQHIGARFADARLPSAASTLDKSRSPGDQGSPARFRDVARNRWPLAVRRRRGPRGRHRLRARGQLLHPHRRPRWPGPDRRHLVAAHDDRAPGPGVGSVDLHRVPVLRARPRRAAAQRVRLRLLGLPGRVAATCCSPSAPRWTRSSTGSSTAPGRGWTCRSCGPCSAPHSAPAATAPPTVAALLTMREQVIGPILAGVRSPRMGRKPVTWTSVDRDYEKIRIDMQTLFRDLGIRAAA